MIKEQIWIRAAGSKKNGECVVFIKDFFAENTAEAVLDITACGVYYAELNGQRIGHFVMAPGYTQYESRHQYQSYDITGLLTEGENHLEVTVARGWYGGRVTKGDAEWTPKLIAEISIKAKDNKIKVIGTDTSWKIGSGSVVFSDIYDGEIYNALKETEITEEALSDEEMPTEQLIFQEERMLLSRKGFSEEG